MYIRFAALSDVIPPHVGRGRLSSDARAFSQRRLQFNQILGRDGSRVTESLLLGILVHGCVGEWEPAERYRVPVECG